MEREAKTMTIPFDSVLLTPLLSPLPPIIQGRYAGVYRKGNCPWFLPQISPIRRLPNSASVGGSFISVYDVRICVPSSHPPHISMKGSRERRARGIPDSHYTKNPGILRGKNKIISPIFIKNIFKTLSYHIGASP